MIKELPFIKEHICAGYLCDFIKHTLCSYHRWVLLIPFLQMMKSRVRVDQMNEDHSVS